MNVTEGLEVRAGRESCFRGFDLGFDIHFVTDVQVGERSGKTKPEKSREYGHAPLRAAVALVLRREQAEGADTSKPA